jgi:hypothetical protein
MYIYKAIMDNNQCNELKNIQYKSMLLSKNITTPDLISLKSNNNNIDIDKFLDDEKNICYAESWNKMDKAFKVKKLYKYAEHYCIKNNCPDNIVKNLKILLKSHLDKKRLINNKEVEYCKEKQEIINIPNLNYKNKRFTIDRADKRVSTIKSLAPLKSQLAKTIKKKSKKRSPKIVVEDNTEDNNKINL